MRQYGPGSSRSFPQDRNPSTVAASGTAGVTGGATTIEATYTVPANRRAFIGTASVVGIVVTALAVGQTLFAEVVVTPSGGGTNFADVDRTPTAGATGTKVHAQATSLWLKAGDAIDVRLAEDAGAGTGTGNGGLVGVEFDA